MTTTEKTPEKVWVGCIGKGIIVSQNPRKGMVKFVPSKPELERAGEMRGLLEIVNRAGATFDGGINVMGTKKFIKVQMTERDKEAIKNLLATIEAEEKSIKNG